MRAPEPCVFCDAMTRGEVKTPNGFIAVCWGCYNRRSAMFGLGTSAERTGQRKGIAPHA